MAAGLMPGKQARDPSFWEAYRNEVVNQVRTFRVYGLQVQRAVFADLPSLFVPLKLAPIAGRDVAGAGGQARSRERRSLVEAVLTDVPEADEDKFNDPGGAVELGAVLAEKRRFALIAGPGSGKTTTLKWLALISALGGDEGREIRRRFGLSEEPLHPVLVRFRSLADRIRARGLEGVSGRVGLVSEFLAAEFESGIGGQIPSRLESLQIAEELLTSSKCIFLFDALDEVPDQAMRSRLFDAVADLIARYPEPRVIVCSRPYALLHDNVPLDLSLYEPLPLNPAGQRLFAHQWYRAVRPYLGNHLSESDADLQASDLARAASRVPDLAENPLLLSILALVHFNRHGLPVERGVLYDQATLAMLGHWERDPAGRNLGDDAIPGDWARTLDIRETGMRRVVEFLAQEVQFGAGGADFTRDVAVGALARGLETVVGFQPGAAEEAADLFLRLLVERSGLVQERSPGVFAFVHLSFQDYLAARWCVQAGENSLKNLASLAEDARYGEVLRFAVAILVTTRTAEGDERALHLIQDVRTRSAVVASACLLEAPHLQLEQGEVEDLARGVWKESTVFWKRHIHPRLASRLIWTVLQRSERSDELLLEFLALEPGDRRRPMMGPEEIVSLLTSRPPRELSERLQWVLRQVARAGDRRSWLPLWSIATLILVESGCLQAHEHVPALIRLLGEEHWRSVEQGTLSERAERLLRKLYGDGAAEEVGSALTSALLTEDDDGDRGDRIACATARLLISIGGPSEPDPIEVLTVRGLRRDYRQEEIADALSVLMNDDQFRERTRTALIAGLKHEEIAVRRGCARILRRNDAEVPLVAVLLEAEPGEDQPLIGLRDTQPAVAAFAEALWDEEQTVAWRAAVALLREGLCEIPGIAQALVRTGLSSADRRSYARDHLQALLTDPSLNLAVKAALLDGVRSSDKATATASALLLVDLGDVRGPDRVARITGALLQDPGQVHEALERIGTLYRQGSPAVVKAVGAYLGMKDFNTGVASRSATLMVDLGEPETPNLARGFVLGGLADKARHDDAVSQLKRLLDEPKCASDARKVISEGLNSTNSEVAWGCARCLWECAGRTDPGLAAAITRAGLRNPTRRETARAWLVELLSHPRTARKALAAVDEAATGSLSGFRYGSGDYDYAWEIGRCLLTVPLLPSEYLVKALVVGGVGRRERHSEAVDVIGALAAASHGFAMDIEEELWSALAATHDDFGPNAEVVAWGAARVLLETQKSSILNVLDGDAEDGDADDADQRATAFLRTLVHESDAESLASEALQGYLNDPRTAERVQESLAKLLDHPNEAVAFAAAKRLIAIGEFTHRSLATALIRRGPGWYERRDEASRMLDELLQRPLVGVVAREALQEALWSTHVDRAWSAAVYLMDGQEQSISGVARALAFAGFDHHGYAEDAEVRFLSLLEDQQTRSEALDALRAALLRGQRGDTQNVASLLVLAGEHLHQEILAAFNSEHVTRRWPFGALSCLVLSGRIQEARAGARRFGYSRLLHLLEASPSDEPGFA